MTVTIPKGTLLFRSQPVECSNLTPLKDKDTGKVGVYFSDGIFIPMGMILEYDKPMFLCMYKLMRDIEIRVGKYDSGNHEHVDNLPWPIYRDVFHHDEWTRTVNESEIFLRESLKYVKFVKTFKEVPVKLAYDIVMTKLDLLKFNSLEKHNEDIMLYFKKRNDMTFERKRENLQRKHTAFLNRINFP